MMRTLFTFLLACIVFLAITAYRSYRNTEFETPYNNRTNLLPGHKDNGTLIKKGTEETIIALAKVIQNAKKHVRGTKTSNYLTKAILMINDILKDLDINIEGMYKRVGKKSSNICPEKYMGAAFGFPMYYKGFETEKCNYSVPIFKLVTVIKYIDFKHNDLKTSFMNQFISSVYATVPNISIFIAADSAKRLENLKSKYALVDIVQQKYKSEGTALNSLVQRVKTPYVLVARNMEIMTNDSRLERLVREIESLRVAAAGGSFRYSNGHWKKGCFQSVYRNYTLKYVDGYDESFHECLFCDYVQGPFVTTTRYLKENAFNDYNENNGLFEDWFLRAFQIGGETVVCPDSMFHVENKVQAKIYSDWKGLMQKFNLYIIFTQEGKTIIRECGNEDRWRKGSIARPPCRLQLNTDAVNLIMRTCEENDVICELYEGTSIGAVKMGKPLPWELDFDIRFLSTNCSKCKRIERAFKKAGLRYDTFASVCCNKKLIKPWTERIFRIYYHGYRGDLMGHPVMDSDLLVKAGLSPTKLFFGGQWVNFARNPGLYMRNRYGKEMYRHAEHWMFKGGHDRINYTTDFLPCTEPGAQNCLDAYNADGDLTFADVLP